MLDNPILKGVMGGLRPDPRFTVSEWSDKYRILTTESSAEAGLWRTDRTPYLKEIMDVLSPSDSTQQVKVIKGTQLGLSEAGLNTIFCYMDFYPCPILMIQPTETLMKGTSKRRVTPALRGMPNLVKKVKSGKSKGDIGEMYTKEVPGGGLTMAWSNSSASFRSFSARLVVLDDVDGFGGGFGEGNVLNLGKARADAFSNRKIYINSTPTVEGKSLIEKEYADSDQRHYYMPCPHCEEKITFEWENFAFKHVKSGDRRKLTGDVTYGCPECGGTIEEYQKTKMMLRGEWVPHNPDNPHKGYRIPSFYSPVGWLDWRTIALEFLNAKTYMDKGDANLMQVWQNTRNARTFKELLTGVDIQDPDTRREDYLSEVPEGVMLLTAGVDTQDDRFEVTVIGHGKRGELWFISYDIIPGDPAQLYVQDELDEYLFKKEFTTANGAKMKIFATGLDTGGSKTQAMYDYCQARHARKVFGLKGSSMLNAAVVNKTFNQALRAAWKPYMVGTIAIKDDFYSRLSMLSPPDRYVHFPKTSDFDAEFFKQLTAEKRDETGKYIAIRKRNEAIDCTVYAMVCITILGADIDKMRSPNYYIGEQKKTPTNAPPKRVENKSYLDEF